MSMTNDIDSAKLCDERLIMSNSKTMDQVIVEYKGTPVPGRKYPTLSCPVNVIDSEVKN